MHEDDLGLLGSPALKLGEASTTTSLRTCAARAVLGQVRDAVARVPLVLDRAGRAGSAGLIGGLHPDQLKVGVIGGLELLVRQLRVAGGFRHRIPEHHDVPHPRVSGSSGAHGSAGAGDSTGARLSRDPALARIAALVRDAVAARLPAGSARATAAAGRTSAL